MNSASDPGDGVVLKLFFQIRNNLCHRKLHKVILCHNIRTMREMIRPCGRHWKMDKQEGIESFPEG